MYRNSLRLKSFFLLLCCATVCKLSAQNYEQSKHSFAINQDMRDFNIALLDNKFSSFDSALSNTFRVSYFLKLSPTWQFNFGISNGYLNNQIEEDKLVEKSFLTGFDLDFVFRTDNDKVFPSRSAVAPFLTFGYNLNHNKGFKDVNLSPWRLSNEYGIGCDIKLTPQSSIITHIALDQQLNGDFDTHIQYRLGYKHNFLKQRNQQELTPELFKKDYQPIVNALDSLRLQLLLLHSRVDKLESGLDTLDDYIVQINYQEPITPTPDNPIVKVEPNPITPQAITPKTGVVKSIDESEDKIKTVTKEIPKNIPAEPVVEKPTVTISPSASTKSYYVIVMSTKQQAIINNTLDKYSKLYPGVTALKQPNGFTRVGIKVGANRNSALSMLNQVKKFAEPNAWLSLE